MLVWIYIYIQTLPLSMKILPTVQVWTYIIVTFELKKTEVSGEACLWYPKGLMFAALDITGKSILITCV